MSIEHDLNRIANALEAIVSHSCGNKAATTAAPLNAPVVETEPDPLDTHAKRGRPRKEELQPAVDTTPVKSTELITEQTLREELRQFIVRHEARGKNKGMEAAADLLKKFNAKTVSTIKLEDYATIVEHCRKDKVANATATTKK